MTPEEIKIRRAYFELLKWISETSVNMGRNERERRRFTAAVDRHMKTAKETLPGFDYTRILDAFTVWIEKPRN